MKKQQFRDRREAGEDLAETLNEYRCDRNAIILGMSNGGMLVAAALSEALQLPLDVFNLADDVVVLARTAGVCHPSDYYCDCHKVSEGEIIALLKSRRKTENLELTA